MYVIFGIGIGLFAAFKGCQVMKTINAQPQHCFAQWPIYQPVFSRLWIYMTQSLFPFHLDGLVILNPLWFYGVVISLVQVQSH